MAGTIGNVKHGPPTAVTIDSTVYYSKGGVTCGLEGDVAKGTVDQLVVPHAAVYGNINPVMKGTLAELKSTALAVVWDVSDTAGTIASITPVTRTPASVAVSATYANGTFLITEGVVGEFGEIASGETDNQTVAFSYFGIDSDGTGGAGTWIDS